MGPAIIGALGALGTGIVGSAVSAYDNQKTRDLNYLQFIQGMANQDYWNTQNINMAKDAQNWQKQTDQRNYDYMVAQNQLQQQREDTAHQREVADLKAAGLSPLAALKGSSTGSIVSQAMGVSPVVPQADGTGYANLAATAMSNNTAMAGLRAEFAKEMFSAATDLGKQFIQHKHENIKIATEFENNLSLLEEKYRNEGNLEGIKFINRVSEINTKFNNDLFILSHTKGIEEAEHEAERFSRELGVPTRVTNKSPSWCATHNGRVSSAYKQLINELKPYLIETGSSEHSGDLSSWQGSLGVSAPVGVGSQTQNVPGFYSGDIQKKGIKLFDTIGGTGSAGHSKGQSSGSSKHENPVQYAQERIRAFWADDDHIIYIPYRNSYGR